MHVTYVKLYYASEQLNTAWKDNLYIPKTTQKATKLLTCQIPP